MFELEFCVRNPPCRSPPAPGSDFCAACLAWLRCDSDVDPLTPPPVPAAQAVPASDLDDAWWDAYIAAQLANYV